jgi:hypothetical protein
MAALSNRRGNPNSQAVDQFRRPTVVSNQETLSGRVAATRHIPDPSGQHGVSPG